MKRIIYKSRAKPNFSASDLSALLGVSQRNNNRSGVTGLLIYTKGYFLQVLEGVDRSVDETFSRIKSDGRHEGCKVVKEQQIFEPDFGQWLMGFWTDILTPEHRAAGIVSVADLLKEFDSEWLEGKSELNQILNEEIFKLRVQTAA